MGNFFFRRRVEQLLGDASITVGGDNPWDIVVHDDRFYRILKAGVDKKVSGLLRALSGHGMSSSGSFCIRTTEQKEDSGYLDSFHPTKLTLRTC